MSESQSTSERTSAAAPEPDRADGDRVHRTDRAATVPNLLCLFRLGGSPLLIVLALIEQPMGFLGWFVVLALTDWLDGKIARIFDQRSTLGPRLDSWADATLYGSLLIGALWLKWSVLSGELGWIAAAIVSYAMTTLYGFWKFGRWPSYHTRAAKMSWFFTLLGAACLLADISVWPFRFAMVFVTWTNIEAILISLSLRHWEADVSSLWAVKRRR